MSMLKDSNALDLHSVDRHTQIQNFLAQYPLDPEQIVQWNNFFSGQLNHYIPICVIHSCCGPCSLYPFTSLLKSTNLICYYFNPNIHPIEEYRHRYQTQRQALQALNHDPGNHVMVLKEGKYHPSEFFKVAQPFANEPEGGERCYHCFHLRLHQTAKVAQDHHADYFLSVMSVSVHKSSAQLMQVFNEIFLSTRRVRPLFINFKKKDGTRQGRQLSERLKLYHQPYCGCLYSMPERRSAKSLTKESDQS